MSVTPLPLLYISYMFFFSLISEYYLSLLGICLSNL